MAPLIIIFSINVVVEGHHCRRRAFSDSDCLEVPSWGGMRREGRKYMEQAPWLALWPGLCLTIVVYSLNMFGDAMRDLLDPRLKGSGGRLGADTAKLI